MATSQGWPWQCEPDVAAQDFSFGRGTVPEACNRTRRALSLGLPSVLAARLPRIAVPCPLQRDDHPDGVFLHLPQLLERGINFNQLVVVVTSVGHREKSNVNFEPRLFNSAHFRRPFDRRG
jgi:hypothetical protein